MIELKKTFITLVFLILLPFALMGQWDSSGGAEFVTVTDTSAVSKTLSDFYYFDSKFWVGNGSYLAQLIHQYGDTLRISSPTIFNDVVIMSSSISSTLTILGIQDGDATLILDADEGDDNADTWKIISEATGNDLSFVNHVTEVMNLTSGGQLELFTSTANANRDLILSNTASEAADMGTAMAFRLADGNPKAAFYVDNNSFTNGRMSMYFAVDIVDDVNVVAFTDAKIVIAGDDGNVGIGPDLTPDYFFDVQGLLHADGLIDGDGTSGTANNTLADTLNVASAIEIAGEGTALYLDYGSAGVEDHDVIINFGDDGVDNAHTITMDDGVGAFITSLGLQTKSGTSVGDGYMWQGNSTLTNIQGNGNIIYVNAYAGINLQTEGGQAAPITIDPDVSGAAITQIGQTGDNDTTNVVGVFQVNGVISLAHLYGHMGFADSSQVITATQNVYVKITQESDSLYSTYINRGLTFQGDSIQVPIAGDYYVNWDLSWSGANTDVYHVEVFVNNVGQSQRGEIHRSMSTSNIGGHGGVTFLNLPANAWLSFRIKNTANGNNPTVVAGNVVVSGRYAY